MSAKFDWSKYDSVSEKKPTESFDWSSFEVEKEQPSRARSIISAPIKGALKTLQTINPIAPRGPISPQAGEKLLEEFLPTQDKPTEQFLERAGKIAPYVAVGPEGLLAKGIQALGGAAAGQAAKELGFGDVGQGIAEAVGAFAPSLAKGAGKLATNLIKAPKEKFISGLSKPAAVEAKRPHLATITSERQKQTLKKLNEEAAQLTKKTIQKHVPLVEEIKKGADFTDKWKQGFGQIQQLAEKANPEIDIRPLEQFFEKTKTKYRGIPKLHPEAAKVKAEIQAFDKRPQFDLKNLLKIYRSNNKKRQQIFETAHVTGKQKEFVDFLGDYNRKIAEAIKTTLPEDSAFVKQFENLNREFAQFNRAQETLQKLKPFLSEKPTKAQIEKIASDKKVQKKLELSMGKEGSKEIIQIAQDLEKATDAIRKIPKSEFSQFEKYLPISLVIPYVKVVGVPVAVFKAHKYAKYLYGQLLSSTKGRKIYSQLLNSLTKNDLKGYEAAVGNLERHLAEASEED